MPRVFVDVDPRELRILSGRFIGIDPFKLQRQIAQFGASSAGMPPIVVYEGTDGALAILNGVTRAARIAKLAPGVKVRVEIIGKAPRPLGRLSKIGDHLP